MFHNPEVLFCMTTSCPGEKTSGLHWVLVNSICFALELPRAAFMLSTSLGGWGMEANPGVLTVRCRKILAEDPDPLVCWL